MPRGYFGVGIYQTKCEANVGMLLRAANLYDAAFVFTIGARYRRQASDTPDVARHKPLFHLGDVADLRLLIPHDCALVGVELTEDATPLPAYDHPDRAIYLLGAEDSGLDAETIARCDDVVMIPTPRPQSMNVSMAGSIVLADRYQKALR